MLYNLRALEGFECGRTELLGAGGVSCADMEHRGVYLPLVESDVEYSGRARYDDVLRVTASAAMSGRARLRFDVRVTQGVGGRCGVRGCTVRAVAGAAGRLGLARGCRLW
ncbi:MAG: hypothetical protein KA354_12175 [Phycisphaerae bacterium]|nr:hypothetical protein [Phycisphaerae bacterium]